MVGIFTIPEKASLDEVWNELVYTEARLQVDDRAKDLRPSVSKLIDRCDETMLGQRKVWRAEIVAQAHVDFRDDTLDGVVDDTDHELLHLDRDKNSARYKRYFKESAASIIRLGLETELEKVRSWPGSLESEPEKELRKLAKPVADAIHHGDAAIAERRDTAAATADHRVREIVRLIDDANALRRGLLGELIARGAKQQLDASWAYGFFRRTQRAPKKVAEAPPAPDTTPASPAPGK